VLYFSSTFTGAGDLYLSEWHGGRFQGRQQVAGVNTPSVEGQPNVRRDGLEIFFFSNRPGAISGSNDIYAAARASTADTWSAPVNLGTAVNTLASETRPSLSWDGTMLYFGSNRTGGDGDSDIYVTTRVRITGG
jgi:Tol biopolymer transport system component